MQQLALQALVHQLVQALAKDVGFPQFLRVVLKTGQQAAGKLLALLFGAHDGAEFGVDGRLQHLDGWRAGFQTDPIACPLPHDLGLFQLQLADRRHHNAVAGGFHLLKGTAHLLVLTLRPRQLHDAGHQARFITNGKAGLLAQHLIKNLRFQLHRDAHTAGRKVDAADGRPLHRVAFQCRCVAPGRNILHAGDLLCQLHGGIIHLRLQPVAVFQHRDPARQGKIQLPHRKFVQNLPQDAAKCLRVQIHAAHRQNGVVVVPGHALGQLLRLRGFRVGAVEQDDVGLAQSIQFFHDALLGSGIALPRDVAHRTVGCDHDADGGMFTDHLAGARLGGKIEGNLVVEPWALDHAGLVVFLVSHGPLHHVAHTVDEPHPALAAALQLQGHSRFRDEFRLGGHDGTACGRLRQLVPGTFPDCRRADGRQHQLLHETLDEGGFAAAHRAHHPNVDISAGACADLTADAILFLICQIALPFPFALCTGQVSGPLVVSYETGRGIMPERFWMPSALLWAYSAENLFYNCNSGKSADFPELLFHR